MLAALGGAVLLVGIGLFLVLAAQAGFFGPVPRIVTASMTAIALIAGGLWLGSRERPDDQGARPPGALALVGVGVAVAILTVTAATVIYPWIPVPVAFVLVGALGLAGLTLARVWWSTFLATFMVLGTMLITPVLDWSIVTVGLVVVVGIVAAVLCVDLGWPPRLARSITPALFLLAGSTSNWSDTDQMILAVCTIVFAALSALVAVVETKNSDSPGASIPLAVFVSGIPLGLSIGAPGPWGLIPVVGAAAYLGAALALPRLTTFSSEHSRDALCTAFAILGIVLIPLYCAGNWGAAGFAYSLVVLAIAIVLAGRFDGASWLTIATVVMSVLAAVATFFYTYPMAALSEADAIRFFDGTFAGLAALFTVLCVLLVLWKPALPSIETSTWILALSVITLMAVSLTVVTTGVALGRRLDSPELAFQISHLVITILWVCAAAYLLFTSSERIPYRMRVGYVLVGLAVAKLVLVDLAALPGVIRVLAFVVVGGVLLAVAIAFGRRDPASSRQHTPGSEVSSEPMA